MKPKAKLSKKKSFHNSTEPYLPPLEALQINSVRTRKGSLARLGNAILALNIICLLFSLTYLGSYIFELSSFLIVCPSHSAIAGLDLFCSLQYVLASSLIIIAVKKSNLDYYRKFNLILTVIVWLQIIKGGFYFIFHQIDGEACTFQYSDYDTTIIICGIVVGTALFVMYFTRKLRISAEGIL